MEFATMSAKLGSEVHIIEYADRALVAYQENYIDSVVAKMTAEVFTSISNKQFKQLKKLPLVYVSQRRKAWN